MDDLDILLNSFFPDKQIQYKGKLSITDAADGIEKSVQNANDLLEEALILFNSNRYPRAISPGIIAVNEIGKVELIKKICYQIKKSARFGMS